MISVVYIIDTWNKNVENAQRKWKDIENRKMMETENMKNVLYIHTHDSGRILSPYGYKTPTPKMEDFAGEAAVFRNAYCAGPTCSPSRAAMLTGTYPHQTGMLGLAQRGFSMTAADIWCSILTGTDTTLLCAEFSMKWDGIWIWKTEPEGSGTKRSLPVTARAFARRIW